MTTSPRPWLPIPSPIRRLFTSFPLQTFPPAPLPSSCPPPTSLPRLYVLTADPVGPSWDAESLKWQTFLRLEWDECVCVETSRHASPTGELPFLLLPSTPTEIVPFYKLHDFIISKFEIPANPRMTVYLNLIDTKIHAAWVFAYYLTDAFEKVTLPLLSIPSGPEPLQYLVRHAHLKSQKEELERRCMSELREDVIYAEAEEGYAALSTLLGQDKYFFNQERPGILDAAAFAYTWTVLDKLGDSNLAAIINKYNNLLQHAKIIHSILYPPIRHIHHNKDLKYTVSIEDIQSSLAAIAWALKDYEYAIIGGAALIALGSTERTTEDIDILVKTGTTVAIKNTLSRSSPNFSIDPRTRLLLYSEKIRLDVLTPSLAKIPDSEISHAITTEGGVCVVRPSVLLNYKISTAYGRSSSGKKLTDWIDVAYLVRYHNSRGIRLDSGIVENATAEAYRDLLKWTGTEVSEKQWKFIGGSV